MNSCHAKAAAWAGVAAGAPPFPLLNGGFSSDGTVLLTVIGRPGAAWTTDACRANPSPTIADPAVRENDTIRIAWAS